MGAIVIIILVSAIISLRVHTAINQRGFEKAVFVNEFEDKDDPYAQLAYVVDPMRDGIYEEQAKAVLKARALYHGQHPLVFTCTTCKSQQHCAGAWDFYNVDGDCIMCK